MRPCSVAVRTKDMYLGQICVDPVIWSYLWKIQGQASVGYLIQRCNLL